jgi:1-aminocyclopropane-1-carboxylate deaminase/D-cysteine desulfhydrase-like pyridoxal-dependent ACC family enzyme
MKKRLSGLLLAIGIMAFAPATAAAAEVNMGSHVRTQDTVCEAAGNRGGAAALAALVAAAVAADVDVIACDVNVLNNSLNNLLQNADIHVLENILNNSPILSDITIQDIQVLEDGIQISVLDGPIINLP